ncbi:hypothetical protein [Nitrospira moscoviensis]|uniref:Uncharacterized protein n=1 Tax=Nitrospira moscoviensis TaxID=42253 RepID=A0A0K2GKQ2_NITMO|nr:hypothetical protein [Nitrospira moscoviensis]ALA61202.1 exported protein of unknown function [Nitrospira moscoviensis]
MPCRTLVVLFVLCLASSCGGDKHLPSSNPPEYDPKKVYTGPATPPSGPQAASIAESIEPGPPPIQLPPLEPGPNEKGAWKTVPVKPESLRVFKGVKGPCEVLLSLVQGLGSGQLFAGPEGQALKQSLGSRAESVARSLDRQLFDNFKAQLGPNVADCPSPVPARKSSLDEPIRTPSLLLAGGPSQGSFQLAQATAPGGEREGYTVTKGQVNMPIPPDAVGRKVREWRVEEGATPETAGDRKGFSLINGGYAKKCPAPGKEGAYIVEGDYEFSLIVDQTINYSNTVRTEYNARSIHATLKGRVDDDAMLQYVDLDAALVIARGGTNRPTSFAHQRQHVRFVPDRRAGGMPSEFSNWSVSEWDSALAGEAQSDAMNTLLLAVTIFSGPFYLAAEGEWTTANTCVEIIFTPPTKTKKFVPNESTPVKTELRTKKEQAFVPAKFQAAKERPREGNGRVSPREDESQLNRPATFTYQAPATKVQHSGFRVSAKSRAGVAEAKDGEWELAPSAYVLEFKSHIVQEPMNFMHPQFGMQLSSNGFDAHVEATVPLRRREDDGQWVGEGVMRYETRTTTQPAQCEIRIQGTGTTTFHVNGGSISLDPEPFAVKLIILPGQTEEVAETHCTSGSTPPKLRELLESQGVQGGDAHVASKGGGWRAAFNVTRFKTFIWTQGRQGYEIGGWTPVANSDVVAKKRMKANCGMVMSRCQEETTLILKLADEPDAAASPPK